MREAPRKAPHSVSVIERWVGEDAREQGILVGRLQRWVQFMVLLAALDRVRDERDDPLFLLKGGTAMELRLRLRARTTQDLDAVFRDSAGSMLARLDEALRAGCGGFTFERSAPRPIGDTRSVGFEIKLAYRGRRWGTVPFEVAPAEGDAGADIETLEAVAIGRFGLEGPERVPCLGLRYQIAQKIHACTAPPPPERPENLRVHDLIDLLLLRDLVPGDGWAAVRDACLDTFTVRRTHSWPPTLEIYPSWPQTFTALATELAFAITDIQQAAQQVRAMIKQIDNA